MKSHTRTIATAILIRLYTNTHIYCGYLCVQHKRTWLRSFESPSPRHPVIYRRNETRPEGKRSLELATGHLHDE